MTNLRGTTRAQTIFLRSLKTSSSGALDAQWPSPVILRRWLRKPGFLHAMRSVRSALWYQADFQLLAAATSAAQALQTTIAGGNYEEQTRQLAALGNLIKLAHLRQRFASASDPEPMRRSLEIINFLRGVHPNATAGDLLCLLESAERASHGAGDEESREER
jgi:hypothetical protein